MPSGWLIAISAIGLLHTIPAQTAFCLTGVVIELVGFFFVARQQIPKRKSNNDA